jgi:hypothetical protein
VTAAAVTAASVTAASVTAADAAGEWDSAPARAGEVRGVVPGVLVLLIPVHRPLDLVLARALTPAAPSSAKALQHSAHDTP